MEYGKNRKKIFSPAKEQKKIFFGDALLLRMVVGSRDHWFPSYEQIVQKCIVHFCKYGKD
jgi:hypothetical protein